MEQYGYLFHQLSREVGQYQKTDNIMIGTSNDFSKEYGVILFISLLVFIILFQQL